MSGKDVAVVGIRQEICVPAVKLGNSGGDL